MADSPLDVPIFRAMWMASTFSHVGTAIQGVGAAWALVALGAPPSIIALVQSSITLPILLLALPAGASADLFDRRNLMLGAQSAMLIAAVLLATLTATGRSSEWGVLGLSLLIGCGTALHNPAWQASVGDMVPRRLIPKAIALNSLGFNIARSAGPAAGGAIVAVAGVTAAFAANAASYLALIAVLLSWRERPVTAAPSSPRLLPAIREAVAYARGNIDVRRLLARATLIAAMACSIMALMPVLVATKLGGGSVALGLLLAAFGIGAIAAAVANVHLRARWSTEIIVRSASAAMIVGAITIAEATTMHVALIGHLVAGWGWVLAMSTFNITIQLVAPRPLIARSIALVHMSAFGGWAAGSWVWGYVAETRGLQLALLAAAAGQGLAILFGLRFPISTREEFQ